MSGSDFRITRQRRLILQELRKSKSHPTADDIYLAIRKTLPKISLGTVYRNLEILSDMGLITKMEGYGSQRRYDGNVTNHYHVRCIKCGRVDDVPDDSASVFESFPVKIQDYTIISHSVNFDGICRMCEQER